LTLRIGINANYCFDENNNVARRITFRKHVVSDTREMEMCDAHAPYDAAIGTL